MDRETSSQAKAEELLSIAAHDLRNPIFCIQGYTDMLATRELPPKDRADMLARIRSCSRFMEQIVGDLLDAAALEGGKLPLRPSPVTLPEILSRAIDSMRHSAESRGASLAFAPGAPGPSVLADAARIEQVVVNLVSNALKHVEPGSGTVEVRLHEGDGEVVVEVADNGSGIAPENLERIFDKYFQADEDRQRGSLGLGLFIARMIVEAHGGRLWARSAGAGRGASFCLSLPAHDPERDFRRYKALRGTATPPPRRLPAAPAPRYGLALPLALTGLLTLAALLAHSLPLFP